jgi:hypothetical protein
VNAKDFQKAQQITLLHDHVHFYVIVAAPPTRQNRNEPYVSNVAHGVYTIPAGGTIYAFDRTTGKTKWIQPTLTSKLREKHFGNLQLVLERFDDLPIFLLTTARQRQQPAAIDFDKLGKPEAKGVKFSSAVVAIDKASGKLLFDEVYDEGPRPFFHAIHGDPRGGVFEVISGDRTLRFSRPPPVDAEKP